MTSSPDVVSMLVGPAVTAAVVSALVSFLALWITGRRDERRRRRELFAEAYATCSAYREFPYVVRRRRHDQPEEERLRISEELRRIQERLSFFLAWTRIEEPDVGKAFDQLVRDLRAVAGSQIADSWNRPAITDDASMNIADVDLSGLRASDDEYLEALARHVRPWWKRRKDRT